MANTTDPNTYAKSTNDEGDQILTVTSPNGSKIAYVIGQLSKDVTSLTTTKQDNIDSANATRDSRSAKIQAQIDTKQALIDKFNSLS